MSTIGNAKSLTKRTLAATVLAAAALTGVLGGLAAGEASATPTTDPSVIVAPPRVPGGVAEGKRAVGSASNPATEAKPVTSGITKAGQATSATTTLPPPPPPPPPT